MFTKQKKAFTLIELIVVIAILAILAVALIPLINNFIEKSRISQIMTTAATLETAAVAFNADVASFPQDEEVAFDGSELVVDNGKANWDGPYLNRNTEGVSPWGSEMILTSQDMFVGSDFKEEYVLIVFDDKTANIPTNSMQEIDRKTDGSVNQKSGKVQFFEDDSLLVAIITDAFTIDEKGLLQAKEAVQAVQAESLQKSR